MSLVQLFFIFMYIGLFAIGGGLVGATFVQQTLVERFGIISSEKFFSMLAISESTPGPIGINLATYVGTELYGPVGGIICTIGEVLPSLVIIMIIAKLFSNFQNKPLVKSAFLGLRPATTGMILVALIQVFLITILNIQGFLVSWDIKELFVWPSCVLYILCLIILFRTKLHPVVIIMLGAIFGVLFL